MVFHDGGELADDLGIVQIPAGGGAPEGQVIIDEEGDERAAGTLDLQAIAQAGGEHG